jgi:hypothetical protein
MMSIEENVQTVKDGPSQVGCGTAVIYRPTSVLTR